MYYVYRITSLHKGDDERKTYIGSTSDIISRTRSHRNSPRYKGVLDFNLEILSEHRRIGDCLIEEFKQIDIALGGTKEDGHREHFEGSCLNRSITASTPLGEGLYLCYNSKRQFYVK